MKSVLQYYHKIPSFHTQTLVACLKSVCKRARGKPLMGNFHSWDTESKKLKVIRVFLSPPGARISMAPTPNCFRTIMSSHLMSIRCKLQLSLPKSWIIKHGRVPHFRRNSPRLFIFSESLRKRHWMVPQYLRHTFYTMWGETYPDIWSRRHSLSIVAKLVGSKSKKQQASMKSLAHPEVDLCPEFSVC